MNPDATIPAELRNLIDSLPVSAHRQPIVEAISAHPVVIVCGETGSGKTTQLPKLCLAAGRGSRNSATGRGGVIGHTQPRRLAATSVAQRIAEELGTPPGVDVGYKIRFNEKVSRTARIKLMTDGILLAESQSDPLLSRYDTIIVDEAHERSLNIDFLLGYLKRLVDGARRDDLKLVITSATIDAMRFARHFANGAKPAPVIEVSGRLFPVEIRYRPLQAPERFAPGGRSRFPNTPSSPNAPSPANRNASPDDDDETDLPSAIEAAIDELWSNGAGDVLVFLPGEREIRDCADHLRRAATRAVSRAGLRAASRATNGAATRAAMGPSGPPGQGAGGRLLADADVIPLFARLSGADQQRVFAPGSSPRIVLATNVAETSLTVPRIRYVVDSGLARVRRYRIRGKVEQLHVEPISQAAANQRAGRCGRVQDGICIRLFDEEDFGNRPQFTEPEILRSSLAAVILRMRALGLDDIDAFPFLDPPSPKAIADGYALLLELGAMDEQRQLSRLGKQLARLPVDPRIARMLLAGHQLDCLAEVAIIASALSAQDPRERPAALAQAADQAHSRFIDPRSDFLAWIRLWRYWQAQQDGRAARGESQRALAARLGREFLSVRRLREWADVHAQLGEIAREIRWTVNQADAKADAVHRALLTGLLGNVGYRAVEDSHYQGAHQQKFWLHPASAIGRRAPANPAGAGAESGGTAEQPAKAGRWVMAAEMVDTGRLYARTVARIRSDWIESAGAHLLSRAWTDPHWEKKAGQVMAQERGVLYGLVIYANRRVAYGAIDPVLSRELMIRQGLVAGEWPNELPFIRHNRVVIAEIERLEHKIRRPDLLVDEHALVAWFGSRIPPAICTAAALERWYREQYAEDPELLKLSRDALLRKDAEGIDNERFPRHLVMQGVDFAIEYHFEPGSANDGVTMTVPLHLLNQADAIRCEWLVPGMLGAKVELLLKSLPQRYRRHLLPLAQTAADFAESHPQAAPAAAQPLLAAIVDHLRRKLSITVQTADFRAETLPVHLIMNFRVVDEHGRFLAMSRQLPQLKAEFGTKAQSSFQAAFARIAGSVVPAASRPPSGGTADSGAGEGAVRDGILQEDAIRAAASAGSRIFTTWSFGELPELLEVESPDGESIVGFPALVDRGDAVELMVFDEPGIAGARHREGVARLFMLALAAPIKSFERDLKKNNGLELLFTFLPGDQTAAGFLAAQIVAAAIDRSCLADGLPASAGEFAVRLAKGRARFTLTAQEIARMVQAILDEHAGVRRKLAATRDQPEVSSDVQNQLKALFVPGFIRSTAFENLSNFPRYLKAIVMRLDKLREQPERDRSMMSELAPLLTRWQRRQSALKGAPDSGFESFRWLLEELRVSLFAQTLRTPMPVSVKRLTRILDQKESQ